MTDTHSVRQNVCVTNVKRRGRPPLDPRVAAVSPRVAARLPWDTYRAASARAAAEGKNISHVVRELLIDYAAGSSSVSTAERAEMRRLANLPDHEREAYFLRSLRNVERMRQK